MLKAVLSLSVLALLFTACGTSDKSESVENEAPEEVQVEEEWISLFDGQSLGGWKGFGKDSPGTAWKAEDGILHFDAASKNSGEATGGDIVTLDSYSDFHLTLEWKISEKGNSGIMFYVIDNGEYSAPYHTGPEYQLLDDDNHPDGKIITHRTADLYDMIESSEPASKAVGEWNETEIIVKNGELEFYLNGVKTVTTTMWTDEWDQMVAESKFKDMPDFAIYKEGRIALQDHGDEIWFRNIKIKEL